MHLRRLRKLQPRLSPFARRRLRLRRSLSLLVVASSLRRPVHDPFTRPLHPALGSPSVHGPDRLAALRSPVVQCPVNPFSSVRALSQAGQALVLPCVRASVVPCIPPALLAWACLERVLWALVPVCRLRLRDVPPVVLAVQLVALVSVMSLAASRKGP